jgi:hypothetical protein
MVDLPAAQQSPTIALPDGARRLRAGRIEYQSVARGQRDP